MTIVLAGLVAAGLSWFVNGLLVDRVGRWWVIAIGPGFEEIFKTGLALFFNASILGGHLVFGLVEALRDITGRQRGNIVAGLASVAGHSLFGFLAGAAYINTGSIALAIIIPWGVHFLWNGGILLFSRRLTG